METMFAPSVVRPPCARNRACRTRLTLAITTVIVGPIRIEASPVPDMWEQVPVRGTGIGKQEITKTAAPTSATIDLNWRVCWLRILRSRRPQAKNGKATRNQMPAQEAGRMPSAMCIASERFGQATTVKMAAIISQGMVLFFKVLLSWE